MKLISKPDNLSIVTVILMSLYLQACSSQYFNKTIAIPATPSKTVSTATVRPQTPTPPAYVINEGDSLSVNFPYRPKFNVTVVVRPDGRVSLPFIGSVVAAGKTPEQFNLEIATRFRVYGGDNGHKTDVKLKQYRIHPGDELEIKFAQHKELNERVVVRPDGRISLVIVKSVIAEGKTPEKLSAELRWRYSKSIKNPDPVVIVRKFVSNRYYVRGRLTRPGIKDLDKLYVIVRKFTPRQIYIGGEVNKPGVYPYQKNLSLLQSIIIAGGARNSAELRQVLIIRKRPGNKGYLMTRNLKPTVKSGKNTPAAVTKVVGSDMGLQPFDVIIVPKTKLASAANYMSQIYNLIPPLKNSSFNFIYDLDNRPPL